MDYDDESSSRRVLSPSMLSVDTSIGSSDEPGLNSEVIKIEDQMELTFADKSKKIIKMQEFLYYDISENLATSIQFAFLAGCLKTQSVIEEHCELIPKNTYTRLKQSFFKEGFQESLESGLPYIVGASMYKPFLQDSLQSQIRSIKDERVTKQKTKSGAWEILS